MCAYTHMHTVHKLKLKVFMHTYIHTIIQYLQNSMGEASYLVGRNSHTRVYNINQLIVRSILLICNIHTHTYINTYMHTITGLCRTSVPAIAREGLLRPLVNHAQIRVQRDTHRRIERNLECRPHILSSKELRNIKYAPINICMNE